MLDKKIVNKIKKYAKLRGGESYNDSNADRLIKAFENATKEWQDVYLQGMDIYLKKIKSGKVESGHSIGE